MLTFRAVGSPSSFGPISLTISSSRTCRSRPLTTWSPPKALDTPRSSSSAMSDDLDARGPEDPGRPHIHDHDEERAQHDQAGRAGDLFDELVLPDESGEIQRRNQRERPPPATHERQYERSEDQDEVGPPG